MGNNKNPKASCGDQCSGEPIENIMKTLKEISDRIAGLEDLKTAFMEAIKKKDEKIAQLEMRLDSLEMDRRRKNLILHDIPGELMEEKEIIDYVKKTTKSKVLPDQAFRIKSKTGRSGPVIVKFDREKSAMAFLSSTRSSIKAKKDLPPNIRIANRTRFLERAMQHLKTKDIEAEIVNNVIHVNGNKLSSLEFNNMTKEMFNK